MIPTTVLIFCPGYSLENLKKLHKMSFCSVALSPEKKG